MAFQDTKKGYPNRHILTGNRLKVLKTAKGLCQICNEKAVIVHHIDGSFSNHETNNLIPLCGHCHCTVHAEERMGLRFRMNPAAKTSKFVREYGFTLQQMAQGWGRTPSYYYEMHKDGRLRDFIEKKIAEEQK